MKSSLRLLPLLALLAAFPPVTTDMYLPALPMLQELWGVTLATVNLTLVLFFVFFSASLLVYGPISDSFGRRPLLLAGIGIYITASALCGLAGNVGQLILLRILQAIGAAAASALSMAIVKDLFEARVRAQLLAHLGVIVALAPMLSPIAGGILLKWLSWHWIFWVQACMGAIALWGVYRMPEPLKTRVPPSLQQMLKRYGRLLKNGRYMTLNLLMALSLCPMFAFIAGSPSIYVTRFGVSEQVFGYYFCMNAFALMAGSFACSRLTKRFGGWPLMMGGFLGMSAGGLAIWLAGSRGEVFFAASMFVVTFCIGMTRPISNNIVLEQVSRDVGAASSLLVFAYFVSGAASMALISLQWPDRTHVISFMAVAAGLILLAGFGLIAAFWRESLVGTVFPPHDGK